MSFLLRIISNPILVGVTKHCHSDACLRRSIAELALGAWRTAFVRRAAEVIGVEVGAPRRKLGGAANGGNISDSLIGGITYEVHRSHIITKSSNKVRFHTIDITNNHG